MSKTITFTYKDKDYTLEFTRKTVRQMEEAGFIAKDIDIRPMTLLPQLFAGSFLAHHRYVKQELIDEIYAKLPDKSGLIDKLAEMYNYPISTLMDEPEENEGNVEWNPSW